MLDEKSDILSNVTFLTQYRSVKGTIVQNEEVLTERDMSLEDLL